MKYFTLFSSVSCTASDVSSDAGPERKSDPNLVRRDALPLYAEIPEYVEKR